MIVCLRSCIVICFANIALTVAHRMCADHNFPKPFDGEVKFCNDSGRWGCCSGTADADIREKFFLLRGKLEERNITSCSHVLKNLLCERRCSSFLASHSSREKTLELPPLCKQYCVDIFARCQIVLALLKNENFSSDFVVNETSETFCEQAKQTTNGYCYPDMIADEKRKRPGGLMRLPRTKPCTRLCVEEVASKLQNPVSVKHAGDNTHRLFVVEQRGIVWTFLRNMSRLTIPFLNLTQKVALSQNSFDERGLLDVQFHPRHSSNGLFYVSYTTMKNNKQGYVRISEMKVMLEDMNRADPDRERILLEVWQPFQNHNGGQLMFGNDGYLYIFIGDGGGGGDVYGYAQNKSSLLGKALRIDVNTAENEIPPYRIPLDNPFVDDPDAAPEIFAYGLRNPWRCSIDHKNRIICGDVGQESWEEVDIIQKGGNYGWNVFEGSKCKHRSRCEREKFRENYVPPIFSYNYTLGKSIMGGFVYNGCKNPLMKEKYIFGDFMSGMMKMLKENKDETWSPEHICMPRRICKKTGRDDQYSRHISTFGEDEEGEIYFASSDYPLPTYNGGRIYKLSQAHPRKKSCDEPALKPVSLHHSASLVTHRTYTGNDFEVRLSNGSNYGAPTNGRVEIRRSGQRWRTICGTTWSIQAGHVICRTLGFFKAKEISLGKYGLGRRKVRLAQINCRGDEHNIKECDLGSWGSSNCSHSLDAGVWCLSYLFN